MERKDVLKKRMKTLMVERKEKSPRWEKWKEGENKMEVRERERNEWEASKE